VTKKYEVTLIKENGEITEHIVEGDDGPNFKDMYKLIDCSIIEITGARKDSKNYDLYIDEEGRLKNKTTVNLTASQYFTDWLSHEGRVARILNVVGNAALVNPQPVDERKVHEIVK